MLDVFEDAAEVIEDEDAALSFGGGVAVAVAPAGDGVEEFGGFEEIAEFFDGFGAHGIEVELAFGGAFVDAFIGDAVFFEQLVAVDGHALGEVFVKDKAEDVVAEFVGVHLAAQGVGDVPELLFELFFMVFRHGAWVAWFWGEDRKKMGFWVFYTWGRGKGCVGLGVFFWFWPLGRL